jgi:hypothetical protein
MMDFLMDLFDVNSKKELMMYLGLSVVGTSLTFTVLWTLCLIGYIF